MNKNDYIDKATAKIFDLDTKNEVSAEFLQHIDEKTDFYNEIGYDNQASEEKATEEMGEADEISAQLGQLHNDFYNPVLDIFFLVFLLGIFGAIYYLLKKFAFGDAGTSALISGASCLSFGICYLHSALSLNKNKLLPVIFSLAGITATGVFNYFILIELDKLMGQNIKSLITYILKTEVPEPSSYPDEEKIIALIIAVLSLALASVAFALIYYIKTKKLANSKTDNKLKKFFSSVCTVMFSLTFVCGILLSVKCCFDLNRIKDEYNEAYVYILELSEKCSSKEDIENYINASDYDFREVTDYNGKLTGYVYRHNLEEISVSFKDTKSKEEIRKNYEEDFLEFKEKTIEMFYEYAEESGNTKVYFDKIMEEYTDNFEKTLNYNVERDYHNQVYCEISLYLMLTKFGNSTDSISASFLELKGDDEDLLYLPQNSMLTEKEQYDFYKNHTPSSVNVKFSLAEIENCTYTYKYIVGEGNFKRTDERTVNRCNEKTEQFYSQFNEVCEIVNNNQSADNEEIAELTGSAIEMPKVSREELEDSMSILGSAFDPVKEFMTNSYYDMQVKYHYDDWYFVLHGMPYEEIYAYDRYGNYITSKVVSSSPIMVNFNGSDGQKKVRINGCYYDKLGYFYPQPDYAPYYTSDNKKYYYYCKIIKNTADNEGDKKEYYLTDRKYKFYPISDCYIDKNGYLCFNVSGNIRYDENSGKYKSTDGNEYTKAFETSWDRDGNVILQDEKYETIDYLL